MSGLFGAINPATGEKLTEYQYTTNEELDKIVEKSYQAYELQRDTDYKERAAKLLKLADLLDQRIEELAKLITDEMGKPLSASKQEVEKCAKHARFYANKAEEFLAPKLVKTEAKSSYVRLDPIGPVYQIIPFNFPLWLSLKSAIPIILVGNSIIHRNAKTCPDVGIAVEKLFFDAGFTNGEVLNVFTDHKQTESLLANPKVRGVTFTGSSAAGAKIAETAGKYLKKSVMELGGSDAVIILDDANIDTATTLAVNSRLRNGGQTCTAGKRFIIDEKIYDEFIEKLIPKVKAFKIGSPYEKETQLGPLAGKPIVKTLQEQLERGLKEGGKVLLDGGEAREENLSKGFYFHPMIVEVDENNVLFQEETFGPLFAAIRAKGTDHALKLANNSQYGLGAVVLGEDRARAEKFASKLEAGYISINKPVSSDSRLPSGGVKNSGFGRECGEWGIQEFANIKAVWVD